MKNIKIILILGICVSFGMSSITQAAYDQEPAEINWAGVSNVTGFWYVHPSTNMPRLWTTRYLSANQNLISTHVQTDEGRDVYHYHIETNYGDPCIGSVSEGDVYWDARFLKCTRLSSVTTTYNCHIYGYQQSADGGTYNYWTDYPSKPYADDFNTIDYNQVGANDLLRYGNNDHTTVVTSVANEKPTGLKWKWHSSGVYSYSPLSATAFDTPLCDGVTNNGAEIDDQLWTWTESKVHSPSVYTDD